ncbi:HNH endonuclease signature motif containing protein [Corynebacterium lubricantis]|uniref:HNH endonuclease signature motif containing protein n=1 Tax=Corynebacterium lubricantis TaxID=541095 RepID=UPI0003801441|nr:HNH endonuclease signature motif containing protein [Corynebacterium lubricantis]
MADEITQIVDQIEQSLERLSDIMMDPDSLALQEIHEDFERLESAFNLKSGIDASFAYVCDRDNAGQLVGANYPIEYLTQRLGLSRRAGFDRIERGKALFQPINIPEPEVLPDDEEDKAREEEERKRREDEERKAQARARQQAKERAASEEKQRIINQALRDLSEHSQPGRSEIYAQAMEAAKTRGPEDLRKFVENLVRQANRQARDTSGKRDPFAAFKRRSIQIGEPDSQGLSKIVIMAPAGEAALLKSHLDAGYAPGSNMPDGSKEDKRTRSQRGFDQLMKILRSFSNEKSKNNKGVGSVVLSVTMDDLANADENTQFPTNTGIDIDCFDALRLGFTGTDFVVQVDSFTGIPLSMGETRLADVYLRMAILAAQAVCAWFGCTKPFSELEIHHIRAYIQGGLTDIDNLLALCREHHRCNNDNRDGAGNKGYIDRDPETGEVAVFPANGGAPQPNTTHQYEQSAGQKLKRRGQKKYSKTGPPRQPDPPLFPVPNLSEHSSA